ncbi:nuclease-related domain-containing protein [Methylorubrum extorquens]|jgi:hypothetical protein|uniref:NERD domain-containing protein n=1 Tax=Methylorubrum extorquens (strain ATCC 14718 / DSM 1338 / JCM 2805 / NCIMB 9133 / AM1) TaxID=272630 RepID=C5B5M9_METEA|nr:nuclease-related domain-containing protein [Methylorubrum extorquens]ACS43761.1 Hypothetical protein MexAM1_META2p0967 [Methylorubrum extorquens AM1]MCP1546399.1 hypothetical protein [Methylorubrum extorquens]MCP1591066.1 hypothetical protein [Methylorubrum extorquens]
MNLSATLPDLLSTAAAIDGTLVGPALVAASALLAASFAGVLWALRTTGGLPPGARNIAARMAAKAELGRVATTSLHDVRIGTPLEVLTIDHLVKNGGGAVVAGSVWLDGEVAGGARDPIWHVRRGRETITIPNPMLQVAQRVQAARQSSHGALPVTGLVLYAGHARFANGAPEGVVPIAQAGRKLAELAAGMPADAARGKAWTLLCAELLKPKTVQSSRRTPVPAVKAASVVRLDPNRRSVPRTVGRGSAGGEIFAFPGSAPSRG